MMENAYSETDLATRCRIAELCPYEDEQSRTSFYEGFRSCLIVESVRACSLVFKRMRKAQQDGVTEVRWRDICGGMAPALLANTLQVLEADGLVEQWLDKRSETGVGRMGLYVRLLKPIPPHQEYAAEVERNIRDSRVQRELASVGSRRPLHLFNPASESRRVRLNADNERLAG
jgi:hypothetical protein